MKDTYLDKLERISQNKNKNKNKKENKMKPENSLTERNITHGDFRRSAEVSQHLKRIVTRYSEKLTPVQEETLEMIMHKIARLLIGDAARVETWEDIVGYATLAIKDIKEHDFSDIKNDQ